MVQCVKGIFIEDLANGAMQLLSADMKFPGTISFLVLVNRLQEYGLDPVMDEVVVRDVKIYRLSIAGFKTHNDAVLFVDTAKNKYGLKNGWIRRE